MVEVSAAATDVAREFEYYLGYLEAKYLDLEENARSWDSLSADTKDDFLAEWPLANTKLNELRRLIERAGIPDAYRNRHARLMRRIEGDQPIVDDLRDKP